MWYFGVLVGSGGTLGGHALLDNTDKTKIPIVHKKHNNFDIVPYDADGDVYITKHGKKYHREYCYTLNGSKKIKRVNFSDAESAGLEPCSKCQ